MRNILAAALTGAAIMFVPATGAIGAASDNYYEESTTVSCATAAGCTIFFPELPASTAGKYVTIQELSCEFNPSAPIGAMSLFLTDGTQYNNNARRAHYVDTTNFPVGTFSMREPQLFKIFGGPPRRLAIYLKAKSTAFSTMGGCTIVGIITPN